MSIELPCMERPPLNTRGASRRTGLGALGLAIAALTITSVLGDELASVSQRREYVQKLSGTRKEELTRKLARFQAMPAEVQDQLRRLDAEISKEVNSDQLRKVLTRYADWLATLPATRRSELADMEASKRIDEIKRSFQDWATNPADPSLKREDIEAIRKWFDEFLQKNEQRILESLPEGRSKGDFKFIQDEKRRLVIRYFQSLWQNHSAAVRPTEDELSDLARRLSPEAQKLFNDAKDPVQRLELAHNWFRIVSFLVSKEELQMFFEERLTPQQRDYLESLSADAMKTELIKMYYAGRFRGGFPRPPGPGGPSGRDGPGRNGPGREGPRRDGLPGRANPGDERRPPPIFTPSPFIPGNRGPGSGEKNDRQNQD